MPASVTQGSRAAAVPGLAGAFALALLAQYASGWLGTALFQLGKSPVSPVMLAVLTGVCVRSFIGVAPRMEQGVALASSAILRIGLALVGLRLTLAGIGELGLRALPVVAGCLVTAWLVIPRLARAWGLSGALVTLLTVGTSICGCTAVMAVAPSIRARAEDTGYAVTIIVIVGLVGMLGYPALGHWLFGADPEVAGIFLGSSIHDTSQVIGAALLYSGQYAAPVALDAATVTKLLRNLTLVVVVPALAAMAASAAGPRQTLGLAGIRRLVPGFVLAFVGFAALRTLGDAFAGLQPAFAAGYWTPGLALANQASELLLTVGMAAVGLTVDMGQLRSVGWRPLAAGISAALLMAAVSAGLTAALLT